MSKSLPNPAPIALIIETISSFLSTSSIRALAVFKTLPRNGKIAWKVRSRPLLAEPPAESPSTKNNSLMRGSFSCGGVSLPIRLAGFDIFFDT